jgi:hypothetical protein
MYATMLRGGQDALFNGEMPQGKQIGDIYVAPTWSESLNGAVGKALGGYQMGQARGELRDIETKRGEAGAAAGQLAAETARAKSLSDAEAAQIDMLAAEQKSADAAAKMAQADAHFRLGQQGQDRRAAGRLTKSAGGATGRGSKNEPVRYIDPYSGAETMAAFDKASGTYWNPLEGRSYTKEEMEGKVPESAMTEAQRDKAIESFIKNNKDTMELMHTVDAAQETWAKNGMEPGENPFNWFTKQTGALGDAMRLVADAGKKGAPTQEDYAAAQAVINNITVLRAGLSQTVSEAERISKEVGRDILQDPAVFIKYIDKLETKLNNDLRIANKSVSPRTVQAYMYREGQKEKMGSPQIGPEAIGAPGNPTTAPASASNKPAGVSQADWDRLQALGGE